MRRGIVVSRCCAGRAGNLFLRERVKCRAALLLTLASAYVASMRRHSGSVRGSLTVSDDLRVEGSVDAHVIVRARRRLIVTGALMGVLVIEPDATVAILGAFGALVQENLGLLLVAGIIKGRPWERMPGRFAVASGSTIIHNGHWVLGPEGHLDRLEGAEVGSVRPSEDFLEFKAGTWVPAELSDVGL